MSNMFGKMCPACAHSTAPRIRVCRTCGYEFYPSRADPDGPIKKAPSGAHDPAVRLGKWQRMLAHDERELPAVVQDMKPLVDKRNKLRRRVQIHRQNIRNAKRAMGE